MELIDLVRAEYGYSDEYILGKTKKWLVSCIQLIERRKYEDDRRLSLFIAQNVGMLLSENAEPVPSYDEAITANDISKNPPRGCFDDSIQNTDFSFLND